jgi:hypothetical protein
MLLSTFLKFLDTNKNEPTRALFLNKNGRRSETVALRETVRQGEALELAPQTGIAKKHIVDRQAVLPLTAPRRQDRFPTTIQMAMESGDATPITVFGHNDKLNEPTTLSIHYKYSTSTEFVKPKIVDFIYSVVFPSNSGESASASALVVRTTPSLWCAGE